MRDYKWHRWSECLPEIKNNGCSEFVEVCFNGCLPQIACWNTNLTCFNAEDGLPFWQTNSGGQLFRSKNLKYIDEDKVWWRYIEYPEEKGVTFEEIRQATLQGMKDMMEEYFVRSHELIMEDFRRRKEEKRKEEII